VVDPLFRAQFELGRATLQYETLLREVPAAFVGRPEMLAQLATLLCEQMQRSFRELGMSFPPWRHARAVLGKWRAATSALSESSEDECGERVRNRRASSSGSSKEQQTSVTPQDVLSIAFDVTPKRRGSGSKRSGSLTAALAQQIRGAQEHLQQHPQHQHLLPTSLPRSVTASLEPTRPSDEERVRGGIYWAVARA